MNKYLIILLLILFSCQNTPYVQGKRLYEINCSNCHMNDGSGLSALIPTINNSKITYSHSFVCILYRGKSDTIFSGNTFLVKEMPAFKHLSSTEVTNIINYINHKWFPPFKEKSIQETTSDLEKCIQNIEE